MDNNFWQGYNLGSLGSSAAQAEAEYAAEAANRSAKNWRARTQSLEAALNRKDELYLDFYGQANAQHMLKEAALHELARLDPGNALLSKEYREKIYDDAYKAGIEEIMGHRRALQQKRDAQIRDAKRFDANLKTIKWSIVLALLVFFMYLVLVPSQG